MSVHAAFPPDAAASSTPVEAKIPLPQRELEPEQDRVEALLSQPDLDYEACLDYVRQVGSSMRAAQARVRTREAMAEELSRNAQEQTARAAEALRQSEERMLEVVVNLREAETRAERAEARAREAEAWLNRLFETMQRELHVAQSGVAPKEADPETA